MGSPRWAQTREPNKMGEGVSGTGLDPLPPRIAIDCQPSRWRLMNEGVGHKLLTVGGETPGAVVQDVLGTKKLGAGGKPLTWRRKETQKTHAHFSSLLFAHFSPGLRAIKILCRLRRRMFWVSCFPKSPCVRSWAARPAPLLRPPTAHRRP